MYELTVIDNAFLKQSKFAANSIHKIITRFSLPNLLHFSLFLCEHLTKFAIGHSYIARIFHYWARKEDFKGLHSSAELTVLQRATACSPSLPCAVLCVHLQNFTCSVSQSRLSRPGRAEPAIPAAILRRDAGRWSSVYATTPATPSQRPHLPPSSPHPYPLPPVMIYPHAQSLGLTQ